jgi:hypothetical protein
MPSRGTVCPLRCGQCCEYWRDVWLLADEAAAHHPNAVQCPHEGRRGCRLPRGERPLVCLDFICGVAKAVIDGKIDHNEGVRLKEDGHLDVPYFRTRRRGG